MVTALFVTVASGGDDIDIDDDPTALQWVVLAVLLLTTPAVVFVAWAVSKLGNTRVRRTIAVVSIVVALASDLYQDDSTGVAFDVLYDAAIVVGILWATGVGLGAVLGWALRATTTHLKSAGRLMVRALPVVLLTVLAFFNTTVWAMGGSLSAGRMCLVVLFMGAIAAAFLFAGLLDSVKPIITATASRDADDDLLAGTPFAAMPDAPVDIPLHPRERVNVLLVTAVSQIVQVLIPAVVTGFLFFVLGLIALTPSVMEKLAGGVMTQCTVLDISLPVTQAQVHVTAFLAALTFMYVSARAVGGGEYRREFLDPIVEELRLTVVARDRYISQAAP